MLFSAIDQEEYRAWALSYLAPHLPETLLSEVLTAARALGKGYYRGEARVRTGRFIVASARTAGLVSIWA